MASAIRAWQNFQQVRSIAEPPERADISAFVLEQFASGIGVSRLKDCLGVLDDRYGVPTVTDDARKLLRILNKLYPRGVHRAPIFPESVLAEMALAHASDTGRWIAPSIVVSYRLQAPWSQLDALGPADVAFSPDREWVEISLPAVDSGCGRPRQRARVVRLLAEPGRLTCPVHAVETLLTQDGDRLLPRHKVSAENALPRIRRWTGVYGDGATEEEFQALVLARSLRRLIDARDRVIITCAYEGLLRIGSLELIRLEHLERTRNGFRARLVRSKANQGGKLEYVQFVRRAGPLCAVAALEAWLALIPWETGPLVPQLNKTCSLLTDQAPPALTGGSSVGRLVMLAQAVSYDVRPSGHTLRRSAATHLYRDTKDLKRVNTALHHRGRSATGRYIDLSADPETGQDES